MLAHASAVLVSDAASLRQRWRLFGAQQELDQRRMRGLGLRYVITSAGPEPSAGVITADVLGSGSSPGYGIAPGPGEGAAGLPAEDRYVRSLSGAAQARYVVALDGPDDRTAPLTLPSGANGTYTTGGCVARARARLYGDVRSAMEDTLVPQDVDQQFDHALAGDHAYQGALGRWRSCMAEGGRKAKAPADLIRSLQAEAARSAPSALAPTRRTRPPQTGVATHAAACGRRWPHNGPPSYGGCPHRPCPGSNTSGWSGSRRCAGPTDCERRGRARQSAGRGTRATASR